MVGGFIGMVVGFLIVVALGATMIGGWVVLFVMIAGMGIVIAYIPFFMITVALNSRYVMLNAFIQCILGPVFVFVYFSSMCGGPTMHACQNMNSGAKVWYLIAGFLTFCHAVGYALQKQREHNSN